MSRIAELQNCVIILSLRLKILRIPKLSCFHIQLVSESSFFNDLGGVLERHIFGYHYLSIYDVICPHRVLQHGLPWWRGAILIHCIQQYWKMHIRNSWLAWNLQRWRKSCLNTSLPVPEGQDALSSRTPPFLFSLSSTGQERVAETASAASAIVQNR